MNRLFLALMLAGCGDEEKAGSPAGTADTGQKTPWPPTTRASRPSTDPVAVDVDDVCEPLSEGACMLPWPSDRYLDRHRVRDRVRDRLQARRRLDRHERR